MFYITSFSRTKKDLVSLNRLNVPTDSYLVTLTFDDPDLVMLEDSEENEIEFEEFILGEHPSDAAGRCDCVCGWTMEQGYPCIHGISVLSALRTSNKLPTDKWGIFCATWYSPAYHTITWKKQYASEHKVPPLSMEDLEEGQLLPWEFRPAKKGRPTVKRKEKANSKTKCSGCGNVGHNIKTCTGISFDKLFELYSQ